MELPGCTPALEQPSCTSAAPFVISMHHLFLGTQIILHKAVVSLLPVPTISGTSHIPLHTSPQQSFAIRALEWGLSKHQDGRCAGQHLRFLVVSAETPKHTACYQQAFLSTKKPLRCGCKEES